MAQDQIQYLIQEFREHRAESTKKMDAILVQTTKTNGRVTSLEANVNGLNTDVSDLKATGNTTKGSNRIIKNIWQAAGAVAIVVITWYLSTKK